MHMEMRNVKLLLFIILIVSAILFRFYSIHHPGHIIDGDGKNGPKGMVYIPSRKFTMGSNSPLAKQNEQPAHKVKVNGFWIDKTDVTNAQFATFVNATGYLTTAERKPDWSVFAVQLPPGTTKPADTKLLPGAMVFVGTKNSVPLDNSSRWWRY